MDFEFDPEREEGTDYGLLPKGVYPAVITDATTAPTRNGAGAMLHLTWQLNEPGPFQNRYVWQSILYQHTSPEATRIGRAKIKDICVACGIAETITDLSVFKFKPCLITVGIEVSKDDDYPPKNKVTRVNSRTVKTGLPAGKSLADFPFNDEIPYSL
jgi:hypothetical protein